MDYGEKAVETLTNFIYEWCFNMLKASEEEQYEEAAQIRDDINLAIKKTTKFLIGEGYTKLNDEAVEEVLNWIKNNAIQSISEEMDIPKERKIYV